MKPVLVASVLSSVEGEIRKDTETLPNYFCQFFTLIETILPET